MPTREAPPACCTDETLMARYVRGDAAAFQELFSRYYRPLIGRMRRRGATEAEAQDLVQQAFLNLHRARHDFRADAELRPYLLTIALNAHRAHLRSAARHPEHELAVDPSIEPRDPQVVRDPVEVAESRARVRAALSTLPPAQREVIEMHWLEGRPFREIATGVGASLSAVKVRAFRGYQRLRELLKDPEGVPG